ncbi:MAG: DUF2809 domain-containing protein [Myxococcota bacterium]
MSEDRDPSRWTTRWRYGGLVLLLIAVGLLSRRIPGVPPSVGDGLWAMMICGLVGFVVPTAHRTKIAITSVGICFAVEFSQRIDVEWLNALRTTLPGRLVLGRGFLWSDLVAYSVGVLVFWLAATLRDRPVN